MLTAEPSGLSSLIDLLVEAPPGRPGGGGASPPVLVVAGTADAAAGVLTDARARWALRAPAALIDPSAGRGHASLRSMVAALALGLGVDVPGRRPVVFARVVLAQIAMVEPVRDTDADRAAEVMQRRLDRHRDRAVLADVVGSLLHAGAPLMVSPEDARRARVTADLLVRRLGGWRVRRPWAGPLAWFAHQDRGRRHDPLRALVELSRAAHRDDPTDRAGVDDLLVAALLGDLRAAHGHAGGGGVAALALIDHGDDPVARAFTAGLVRARRRAADAARAAGGESAADPLVVVSTGSALTAALAAEAPPPPGHEHGHLADDVTAVPAGRPWLAVAVDSSGAGDVLRRARRCRWPASLRAEVVAHSVHRLTDDDGEAAELVLRGLERRPHRLDDLDALLRRRGPSADRSLEEHLLAGIVDGLDPHGYLDPQLHDNLVTLAAARDEDEAGALVGLLATPIIVNPLGLVSRVQRPGAAGAGRPRPGRFARFLLLRALAERPDTHPASWHQAFTRLRDLAVLRHDVGGRLHHELALGGLDGVAAELEGWRRELPPADWLTLLDAAVATPDPRRRDTTLPEPDLRPGAEVAGLVSCLHALADPSFGGPGQLRRLYRLAESSYRWAAGAAHTYATDRLVERAEHYGALADALGPPGGAACRSGSSPPDACQFGAGAPVGRPDVCLSPHHRSRPPLVGGPRRPVPAPRYRRPVALVVPGARERATGA